MTRRVATPTQCYEILLSIVALPTPPLNVVDLKAFRASAALTSPAVTF
jgi:hypothetical protein